MLSKSISSSLLELILGVFLLLLSLYFLINNHKAISTGKFQTIAGGSISGFAAGLLGTGGAVRGITMSAFNLEKNVYVATSAAIDMCIDFSRSIVYMYNGYISKDNWIFVPFLLVIGFAGTYIGKKLLNKLPQEKFKLFSLVLILLIGIASIIRPMMHL